MISPQFLNDCIAGNEDAIQTLIRTHQRPVFQLALSILDDASIAPAEAVTLAEAATRDTFMKALDRLGSYREELPFSTWLYRITISMAQKQARQARLSRFFHKLIGRRAAFTGQAGLGSELNTPDDAVWQAVRGLDEKLRIPIVLRYYHEYPISEIARLLRISEGAVHARLDAAREKIAGGVNLPA